MSTFYTKDELIQLYGKTYATLLDDSLIPKKASAYDEYMDNMIDINTPKGIIQIPILLIKDILSNQDLYKFLINNLDNMDGYPIKLKKLEDGKVIAVYKLSRADLVFALRSMNTNILDIQEQINIISIVNLSTNKSCDLKYNNFIHKSLIDGAVYSMDAKTLLNILTESEDEFEIFLSPECKSKYEKKYIFYMLRDFIERERIFDKYIFKDSVYKRYNKIINHEYIDFESLNRNQKTDDYDNNGESIVENIHLDDDFFKEIMKYSKKTYSPLEKAIHAYLRMCEILTYDESALINSNISIDERIDHEHLASINTTNNIVVCYEFAFIYAYILNKLGINYTMNAKTFMNTPGYAYVEFKVQEYLIKADALHNILNSDLTNMKVGGRINGLTCTNENITTQRKFNQLADKVRLNIIKRKEIVETYDRSIDKIKENISTSNLSKKDKIKFLLKIITRANVQGVDKLVYQRKIFDSIFSEDENVNISFVSNGYKPFTIVSTNENNYYKYYVVNEDEVSPLRFISKNELEYNLTAGIYKLLDGERIPGILEEKGVLYAK